MLIRPQAILVALSFVAMLVATSRAQEFKTATPDPEARKLRAVAEACIRAPGRYAQTSAQVNEYFTKFYFPSMTGTLPDELARLGALRFDLFKKFLWGTEDEALQKGVTDLTYAAMVNIIKPQQPPYHPAVRYNAVLALGMLDEQYAREGANPRPPKPLLKANKLLTNLVGTATTQNLVIPPVILGAVIGLERHAQLRNSLDPASIQAMTAALLKIVAHEQPIQDMDRAAYAWLQVRSASALANLGSVGENNAVHDGLVKLIASLRSLDDRCATAALLAKIKYEGAKIDSKSTAEGLFAVARDLATTESKRAKEFQDAQIGLGPGAARSSTYGGGIGYGQPGAQTEELFPKRQVLDRLVDLKAGLTAVKPVLAAEDQARVDAVLAAMNPVIMVAMNKAKVELELTQAIVAMSQAIERAVPAPTAAPQAPAAPATASPSVQQRR